MLKEPVEIKVLGDPIIVKEGSVENGFGYFEPDTGTVVIKEDQPEFGKFSILLHELLHVTEEMLIENGVISERLDGAFTTAAPFGIATILAHLGLIKGIGSDQWMEFIESEGMGDGHSEVTQEDIENLCTEHVSDAATSPDYPYVYLNSDNSLIFHNEKETPILEVTEKGDFIINGVYARNDQQAYRDLKDMFMGM